MTNPIHICILCPDRERIPFRPPVCDACRAWLAAMIGDVRQHAKDLVAEVDLVPDTRTLPAPFGPRKREWHDLDQNPLLRRRDYISALLPSGSNGNRNGTPPVTGSRNPPMPINVDRVDITSPARQGSREPMARGALGIDEEQVGHLPLATTLETWIRDWCERRDRGENGPVLRVDQMCQWLYNRTGWACDEHPAVDEFADEIRSYRSTMAGLLGLIETVDYKEGVACPKCENRSLYRLNGLAWVECAECPAIMSPTEYEEHTARTGKTAMATIVAYVAVTTRTAKRRPKEIAGRSVCESVDDQPFVAL